MMKSILAAIAVLLVALPLFARPMKDPRDGRKYETVKIGKQVWMAENLNYATGGSLCYDNNPDNCRKYGRLYTWDDALDACPTGWHLPSREEWETLFRQIGSAGQEICREGVCGNEYPNAGMKLKSTKGWKNDGNGEDTYGFSAIPAGLMDVSGGFYIKEIGASFWSSSEDEDNYVYNMYLGYADETATLLKDYKNNAFSVRCVFGKVASQRRSGGSGGTILDSRDGQTYMTVKIGNRVWMAEDLNYGQMKLKETAGFEPFWGMDFTYENVYLKKISRKACPAGWRLPDDEDWNDLTRIANAAGSANQALMKGSWGFGGECCEPETDECIEGTETIAGKDVFGFGAAGSMLSPYGGYRGEGPCESEQANYWSSSGKVYTIDRAEENPQLSSDPDYRIARIRCVQE